MFVAEVYAWIVATPVASHAVLALGAMAILVPLLGLLRVHCFAWHAAAYTSTFFYGREAKEADRYLERFYGHGGSKAFFAALWPGSWTGGGASFAEWLSPTVTALVVAALVASAWRTRREIDLPPRRRGP